MYAKCTGQFFFTLYMSYSLACVAKEKLLVCSFCNLVKTTGTLFHFQTSKSKSNLATMHYIITVTNYPNSIKYCTVICSKWLFKPGGMGGWMITMIIQAAL